ncbi:MAG TPA: N-acetylglucosamine-6-phosphate deacetylase [Streptosporangiaceae bacterium]|nr:N-acetylglucosamine-6-phosphate deacetylase [Streptosporangiaceae bacterium]
MAGAATNELVLTAPRLIPATTGSGVLSPGYVLVRDGRVAGAGSGPPPRPPDVELPGGLLLPGFVDLQVNGYFGAEFGTAGAAGWATVVRRLPETGTTAFLPTIITAPVERLAASLRNAAALHPGLPDGARVLGVHMEGPFIAPVRRGAHNPEWITDPSPAVLDELIAAGSGLLRLVTLAPERDGGLAAISQLARAGIVVSVGHSDATAAQVAAAAGAGARMVTHLFNAQRPLHHREPGVPGQALTDTRLTSGLIADLHHVAGQVCAIAHAAAPGRICLVTDAAACAGMPPGRYILGGEPIELPPGDGVPPVRPDGTLAGSALRMDVAVANLVSTGASLTGAVAAATRIPADLIGRPDLGRIAPGAAADLVWLGDDLRTRATWVGGTMVYSASQAGRAAAGVN